MVDIDNQIDRTNLAVAADQVQAGQAGQAEQAGASDAGLDTSIHDGNSNFSADNWREYIPEDLRDRQEWGRVDSIQDVFKNYIEGQKTISQSVRIPDASSSQEDIQKFYAKLGKPASTSEYTFDYTPKEGYVIGKDAYDFSSFQDLAYQANLTKDQYAKLATLYMDIQNQNYQQYQQRAANDAASELQRAELALRQDWGNEYQSNINLIQSKIGSVYNEETLQKMHDAGLFRDKSFLEAQLQLTKMMTGDTIFMDGSVVENVPQNIQALEAKRDALMSEDYQRNKAQVTELNKRIVSLKLAQQGSGYRR